MASTTDFESLVKLHYRALYQFGFSLTRSDADACDLTQQTFYLWAAKGHQLLDHSKVKSWLFTTLHREFLKQHRKLVQFPHHELSQVDDELPTVPPAVMEALDGKAVLQTLAQVDEQYRAPLALFYLGQHSYKEITELLDLPMGTVQSRIARGKAQLLHMLGDEPPSTGPGNAT